MIGILRSLSLSLTGIVQKALLISTFATRVFCPSLCSYHPNSIVNCTVIVVKGKVVLVNAIVDTTVYWA